MPQHVLKRIRKGAYERSGYLVLYTRWINEKWDGPREQFRPWHVYDSGSSIETRVLLDAFRTRGAAYRFVQQRISASEAE